MSKVHRWGMILAFLVIVVCAWVGVRTIFVEDANAVVPAVTGLQLVDAVDALQKQGLLAKVDKVDSPLKADTVVSQNLQAGEKVSSGKVVILRVSKGGSIMPMPDVAGLKFEDGVKRINEAGFKVNKVVRITDKTVPANTIIAQNPAAPQQVAANCMVSLLVSTGATGSGSFVTVPDLSGQNEEAAVQLLEQMGLAVGVSSDTPSASAPAGTVVSTKPRYGAKVPAGTPVNMTFAVQQAGEPAPVEPAPGTDGQSGDNGAPVRKVVVKDTEPSATPKAPASKAKSDDAKTAQQPAAEPVKQPAPAKPEQPAKTEQPSAPKKTAKVRYQVPPLTKPMSLKIEMTDAAGTRVLKDSMVNGSEYISMNVNYSGEAKITIYLGGDFVWQDRYN